MRIWSTWKTNQACLPQSYQAFFPFPSSDLLSFDLFFSFILFLLQIFKFVSLFLRRISKFVFSSFLFAFLPVGFRNSSDSPCLIFLSLLSSEKYLFEFPVWPSNSVWTSDPPLLWFDIVGAYDLIRSEDEAEERGLRDWKGQAPKWVDNEGRPSGLFYQFKVTLRRCFDAG